MRRIATLLLAVTLSGCSREPTPLGLTGEQLMVHSLLVAGADTAQVLVTRTLPSPEIDPAAIGGYVYSRPVSAADVRLISGETTLQLREAPEGFSPCFSQFQVRVPRVDSIKPGCYSGVLPTRIQAGERYRLEVRANGGMIQGATEVPRLPEIGSPEPGARFPVAFGVPGDFNSSLVIPVSYQVPPEVAGVRVTLAVDSLYLGGQRVIGGACQLGEVDREVRRTEPVGSIALRLGSIFCSRPSAERAAISVVPDSVFARVLVAGFDSTYVNYARAANQDSAERSRLQAGINGALGLFAGVGISSTPIVLVSR